MASTADRQKREKRGRDAEDRAATFLEGQGFSIVARRMRTASGEVDLVAFKAPVLAFVEVKARSSIGRGLYSLSERQAARIGAAAEYYLAENAGYEEALVRLDLVVVTPDGSVQHFPNAWQADG